MTGKRSIWVFLVFAAAAVLFALDPLPPAIPISEPRSVPAWATDPTPVRRPTLRPEYHVAGYQYSCSDCHRIIPSPSETFRTLTQHREIRLAHGINTRCFNCHHRTNRDAFVDDLGGEIPWNQPQMVCAKCHGTVYRDWENGSHGRINGFWDRSKGEQTRRRCIECHDPHAPPFAALSPAPGPRTLRMGEPLPPTPEKHHDPLRIHGRPAVTPTPVSH